MQMISRNIKMMVHCTYDINYAEINIIDSNIIHTLISFEILLICHIHIRKKHNDITTSVPGKIFFWFCSLCLFIVVEFVYLWRITLVFSNVALFPLKRLFHTKQLGCQKICAHLVEIETKEESDWLWATFLKKGKLFSHFVFT